MNVGPLAFALGVALALGVSHAIPSVALNAAPRTMANKDFHASHPDPAAANPPAAAETQALDGYYNALNEAEEADGRLSATGMIISLTFLIGATMCFEYAKDQVVEATEKSRVFVMVEAMFGELTVLGATNGTVAVRDATCPKRCSVVQPGV